MDRKQFLKLTGLSISALLFAKCFTGCEDSAVNAPTNVDFTIDLNEANYSILKEDGSFVVVNGILIAKTITGDYIAVSAKCTHEGVIVEYESVEDKIICPKHDSIFSNDGKRQSGPAKKDLVQYKIEVNGNVLRIFS